MSLPLAAQEGRKCVLMRLRVGAATSVIDAMVEDEGISVRALRALQESCHAAR